MISFLTKNIFKYLSSHKTNDVDQSLEQVMMIELEELILNYMDVRDEEEQNAAYEETKDTPIDSSWVIVDSREGKFKCNRTNNMNLTLSSVLVLFILTRIKLLSWLRHTDIERMELPPFKYRDHNKKYLCESCGRW